MPIFGKQTGSSTDISIFSYRFGSRFQLLDNASVTTISALCYKIPDGLLEAAIYADNYGQLGQLLAVSTQVAVSGTAMIQIDFPLPTALEIPAGYYWLAIRPVGSGEIVNSYNANAGLRFVTSGTDGLDAFQQTEIVQAYYPMEYAIWATYNISSIVPPPTTPIFVDPPNKTSSLKVVGQYITTKAGSTVVLRGVNRPSGFTASCTGIWPTNGSGLWEAAYTTLTDQGIRDRMQQMKDAGFNVVRLIFFADWWLNNMSINLNSQATAVTCRYAMRRTIEIAKEYGIYIVLAPWGAEWTSGQSGLPFPTTTIPTPQAFAEFWRQIADYHKDLDNVIYDLWNEPAPPDAATWFDAALLAAAAIRSVNDHLILLQLGYCAGMEWVKTVQAQWGKDCINLVYSNHIYHTAGATIPTTIIDKQGIKDYLLTSRSYSEVVGLYPILIGEIGAWVANGPDETTWFQNTLAVLNEWGCSYAGWEWDQPGTGWQLQDDSGIGAPYPPNTNGTALINAIHAAPTPSPAPGTASSSGRIAGLVGFTAGVIIILAAVFGGKKR